MRIDTLTLTNFRGFERFELALHPQLTVLAGVNGAGKTSVLEGLAVAMGTWFLGFDDLPRRSISASDVRLVQHGDAHPNFERQFPVTVEATGELEAAHLYWSRSKNSTTGTTTVADAGQLIDMAKAHQEAVRQGEPIDLPLLAYYGAGRLWTSTTANHDRDLKRTSRAEGYREALEPRSNQAQLASWMKWRELDRLQRVQRVQEFMEAQGLSSTHAHQALSILPGSLGEHMLTAVEMAVVQTVEGADRFFYSVSVDELVFQMKGGKLMPLSLYSDGYRNLVAMVADIAWRATRLNTHLEGRATREVAGVVLIDEIELHLHPGWQLTVLPRLMKAFPKLQFVVTTHAPLVVSSVPAEHIRMLDRQGNVHLVEAAEGLSANVVLRELMGVSERNPQTAHALAALGRKLEAGDAAGARAQFDQLRAQLGNLDPELQGLEWELRDLEVHGAAD
jgi:predicted ATP-binding protein involved in virulence